MDTDMLRLYQIVHDLGEQLAHNQKFAASLQAQSATLKVRPSPKIAPDSPCPRQKLHMPSLVSPCAGSIPT